MLGETYELVTEDYRYFAEQVSHHPPISAFVQQGKGYMCQSFMDNKSKFGFGGGKGLMEIRQIGYFDYFFEKYNECISIGRPRITANNIVLGNVYMDLFDKIDVINHTNGEKAELQFNGRGWSTPSSITGHIFDA